MSKMYKSCQSNNTTNKKNYVRKEQLVTPGLPNFEISQHKWSTNLNGKKEFYHLGLEKMNVPEAKSSESTQKRNKEYPWVKSLQASEGGVKIKTATASHNLQNVPSLNLKKVKPTNFHEEFMEVWQEF